jgi:hypothetical protein
MMMEICRSVPPGWLTLTFTLSPGTTAVVTEGGFTIDFPRRLFTLETAAT